MIKPIKILFLYVVVLTVFIGVGYLIPQEGIPVRISKVDYKIKGFPSKRLLAFWEPKDIKEQVVTNVVSLDSLAPSLSVPVDSVKESVPPVISSKDSLIKENSKLHLVYGANFEKLLYKFYDNVTDCAGESRLVRILHMGDSQLEGDRITKYLRELMQERFEGCGPGLVPAYDPKKQFSSLWINNHGDWSEHLVYVYPRDIFNNEYGLLGRVAKIDSGKNSGIAFERSFMALPKAKKYYNVRLFLNKVKNPLYISAKYNGIGMPMDTVSAGSGISEIGWIFKTAPKKFFLDFQSQTSPVFLGISLDSLAGVAVDNISMRGQYTPRLDKNNPELYAAMASHLNIGMIILQYGTNMVPTIAKNYEFYYKMLYRQLEMLKKELPDVPVVVVGVGDAGTVADGIAKSFDHIKYIRDAQKKATLKAGYGFFDLYEAMGGSGSIVNWVQGKPKLAMSDYTHFNKTGGKQVAGWIYDAIVKDYPKWEKEKEFNKRVEIKSEKDTIGTFTGNN